MVDRTLQPIIHRAFGVSIICDTELKPSNHTVSWCTTKITMHCRYFFGSYTHGTGSKQRRHSIHIQQLGIVGIISHNILDRSAMLISTGMPGIQFHICHHVIANHSQCPCQSHACESHISKLGLSDYIRAHLSKPYLSKPALSETLSELYLSEPHLSEPHLSEPH